MGSFSIWHWLIVLVVVVLIGFNPAGTSTGTCVKGSRFTELGLKKSYSETLIMFPLKSCSYFFADICAGLPRSSHRVVYSALSIGLKPTRPSGDSLLAPWKVLNPHWLS